MVKYAVINGSIRRENTSLSIVDKVAELIKKETNQETAVVTLNAFNTLFTGDYVGLENATSEQKKILGILIEADVLVFVVPTYHHAMPAGIKNFLDLVECKEIWENKSIALVANSVHGQADGARQLQESINGILAFKEVTSFVVPQITIVNPTEIDTSFLCQTIKYWEAFRVSRVVSNTY